MFRSSNRAGLVMVLLLLVDPASAAPPLNTSVPLKVQSLPRDTVTLPASVKRPVLTVVTPARSPDLDKPPASPPAQAAPSSSPPPTDPAGQAGNESPVVTPARVGSGSLLGAALPPLPKTLQLVMPDQDTRQYAPHELVAVTASMDDAKRLAQVMGAYQARVIRRHKLDSLGMVLSTFRLPDQVSVADVLATIRREYPDLWIDLNHYFRPAAAAGGQRTALYRAIDRQPEVRCGQGLRIGLLTGRSG